MNFIVTGASDTHVPALRVMSLASFWSPIWVPPQSEGLEHAPFGFWLVEALRPRTIVELGTSSGYSLAVFCQAVQDLRLDCRCFGVGQGQGDRQEALRALDDHINVHYKSFAQLIGSDANAAPTHFPDGFIDLLHVDGGQTYETLRADYAAWQSRLSQSTVVVFHRTNVREGDSGVARLWQELAKDHRHFEFLHDGGLGVLGIGNSFPEAVAELFRYTDEPEAANEIRLAYSRLGSVISSRVEREQAEAERRRCEAEMLALQRQLKLDEIRISALESGLARQSGRQGYLTAVASQRAAELEALYKQKVDVDCAKGEVERLKGELSLIVSQRDSILRSTSWRVTRPLRVVKRLFGNA